MKKTLLFLTVFLLTISGIAQQNEKYTQEDVKQFYRTIQGHYTAQPNDSTTLALHFVPIWEREDEAFRWLYMEAVNNSTKEILEQKIIEIRPISSIAFKVVVHGISQPERFAGKWGNRNYFDGFNTGILKQSKKFNFMKTKDFEYQTSWSGRKNLRCFSSGDQVHFKFVQEDERFYVKRLLAHTTILKGVVFYKAPTD